MNLNDKLDTYNQLQNDIFEEFGYTEDWKVYPVDDSRTYFWYIDSTNINFASKMEDFHSGDFYSHEIKNDRFLNNSIWEAGELTMILVDTHVDGNQFLQIFDNKKKCEIPEIG